MPQEVMFSSWGRLRGQVADIANFYRVFVVKDDSAGLFK
jgi:hypothetical protein